MIGSLLAVRSLWDYLAKLGWEYGSTPTRKQATLTFIIMRLQSMKLNRLLLLLARIDQDEMTRGSLSDRPTQDVTSELSMPPEPYRILFS